MGPGAWVVTITLCVLFATIGAYWLRAAQLPTQRVGLAEAVPPLPAIAVLVFLLLTRAVTRWAGSRFGLGRHQILTVYAFVSISVSIGLVNLYRGIPMLLTVPRYVRSANESGLYEIRHYVPEWLSPTGEVTIHDLWHGSPSGKVPWSDWIVPLLSVGGVLLLFYLVSMCLLRLFYTRWSRDERLKYPVAALALDLVESEAEPGMASISRTVFRNRLFWFGALAALLYNLIFIIAAVLGQQAPNRYINIGTHFGGAPPFDAIGMWMFRMNPIVFGLGYLVSMDILFSIWAGFLLLKAEAVALSAYGVDRGSLFLMERKQGMGGYLALTLVMIWAARRNILAALRNVLPGRGEADPDEAGRCTVLLLVGGCAGLLFTMRAVGMGWVLAVVFLTILLVRTLVMSRIRAQAGIPLVYLHVADLRSMVWLLGGAGLGMAGMQGAAGLILLSFLIQAGFIVPHHADCLRLAERSGLGLRRWMIIGVLGVAVGLVLVNLTHMTVFYEKNVGLVNCHSNPVAHAEFHTIEVFHAVDKNMPPEWFKVKLAAAGFVTTAALTFLRRFPWFPFHPVGFLVACAAGARHSITIFIVWLLKWFILKYFGGRLHRQARTFCMGLVMGHFVIATIWGVLALLDWGPTTRYYIGFW